MVAVSASRMERAQAAADKFAIPHAFNDFAAMLALPDIEAVSIATPTGTHLEMVSQALAAGKHVLCEKAFARNADEARQMRDLATATNLTCMVAHEFRFAAPRALAKEMIDAGYVGTPKFVRASMALNGPGPTAKPAKPPPYSPTRDNASQGGGILFSIGSHYIDGLIHWLGRVATVSATLTNLWPERLDGDRAVLSDADNLYLLHLTFENGTIAELTGSMSLPFGKAATIEPVFGTEGTLADAPGRLLERPVAGTATRRQARRRGPEAARHARAPRTLHRRARRPADGLPPDDPRLPARHRDGNVAVAEFRRRLPYPASAGRRADVLRARRPRHHRSLTHAR